jgi:ketosteroid isomerase-like protein
MIRLSSTAMLLALLASCAPKDREASQAPTPLSAGDIQAIRSVDSAYVAAWLRDDTTGVLGTLAPDAILMPAGQHPLIGAGDIRAFWWPQDGSHTRILTFVRQLDEVDGRDDVAWTRGTDTLTFTYTKGASPSGPMGSRSMTLALLRRQANGEWRISRMMWATRTH